MLLKREPIDDIANGARIAAIVAGVLGGLLLLCLCYCFCKEERVTLPSTPVRTEPAVVISLRDLEALVVRARANQ